MSVASKNPFDLLGGDGDEPTVPSVPASAPRKDTVKRDTTSKKRETPASSAPSGGDSGRGGYGRGRGRGGSEGYRDRGQGGYRSSNFEDGGSAPRRDNREHRERSDRPPRRGQRGSGGYRGREMDRHSASGKVDTEKQVAQGWGAVQGDSEWNDEQAGQNIANQEASEDFVPVEAGAEGGATAAAGEGNEEAAAATEPEPEDNSKSFADYMAELELKSPVAELPEARRPNEGVREDKKWAGAKELRKEEDEEYFSGGKSKSKATKQRKEKSFVEIDQRYVEPRGERRGGDRGGRGGGRGGSGGERRGGRGDYRGGERRGGYGGRGTNGGPLNIQDNSAFPSLGK